MFGNYWIEMNQRQMKSLSASWVAIDLCWEQHDKESITEYERA